ncbi:hypothetical protein C6I20_10405 [Aeromicrobium sp. A1-2]|uniref:hypothetical protein n=1 Tax=Aeromicrobium sp. A1-2 TaxID=2107713 RepID=UPI000E486589|nr:hypothetical protein [Aeromicrobium sp. A1-2]AXT85561.1 hypothetical protein C6I20_10405 [Aeromicrobium sp. A1-2]
MLKRLAAAASVSVLAIVGLAPSASAMSPAEYRHSKIVKAIDWDAPTADGGGNSSQRAIDWD